jgi:hypothetical protein
MNDQQVDQFAGWKALLAGCKVEFSADEPLSGYYRTRRYKDGPLVPVAIWHDQDGLNVICDGKVVELDKVWPWAARNPIPYETWQKYQDTGKWTDIDDTVHEQAENGRASIGGNNPPTDPVVIIKEQIDAAKAGATAYAIIKDDETAAKAQTLRSRLLELSGEADEKRKAEKEPHKVAADNVDAKWMPMVKLAKGCADGIRAALEAWESDKLAKRREEEHKAHAAAAEQLAAAAKAEAEGRPAPRPVEVPLPPPLAPRIKGAAGRAASVKTKTVVKAIADMPALFNYMRLRAEVSNLLMELAQKDIDAGRTVPGIITEEKAVVK